MTNPYIEEYDSPLSGDEFRPYPWEQNMTICIAALCEEHKTIVIATDRMLSNGLSQRESGIYKFAHVHPNWGFAFAATDVAPVSDILRLGIDAFEEHDGTVEDARSLFLRVYRDVRFRRLEDKFLQPRGYTLEQFKNERYWLQWETINPIFGDIRGMRFG